MSEPRAMIRFPDGTERDITDLVRVLYDGVINSLDWGSGWWDGEDAAAVGWIGLAMDWTKGEEAEGFAQKVKQYQGFHQRLAATIPPMPNREWTGRST